MAANRYDDQPKNYSILVCGAPKVGKSTLINALCGSDVVQTSSSLKSFSNNTIRCSLRGHYLSQETGQKVPYQIEFLDMPGIESWDLHDINSTILKMTQAAHPICLIYCASPGSFAIFKGLDYIIKTLYSREDILCTGLYEHVERKYARYGC